jgi:hypothetical protein
MLRSETPNPARIAFDSYLIDEPTEHVGDGCSCSSDLLYPHEIDAKLRPGNSIACTIKYEF